MKIGDRVRDKGTLFVGTVVQLDPHVGVATRARFQFDQPEKLGVGKVGDPPPDSMWQKLEELELIDREGNPVTGTAASTTDTAGAKIGDDEDKDTPAERSRTSRTAGARTSA